MSIRVVQVDESQKDEPGVEKAVTIIAGQHVESYARLERVDDMDGKTTENVTEIQMLVPVEDEDADDENLYIYNRLVIDMGEATLAKYLKAIGPFADKARVIPATTTAPTPSVGTKNRLAEWNRRAKEWLRDAGHEVKTHGRLPKNLEEIYMRKHPEDPKPE